VKILEEGGCYSVPEATKGPAVLPELSAHQPPAILGKRGRSYHPQEAKGARRGPARQRFGFRRTLSTELPVLRMPAFQST